MKLFIAFISLFFVAHSFAQSQKKINEQLNMKLVISKLRNDSINVVALEKAAQLLIKQRDFTAAQKRNTQRQGTDLMDALAKVEKVHEQLIRLEKDPTKLVDLNALKSKINSFQKELLAATLPQEMLEPPRLVFVKDSIPVKKHSRKAQNEWMREELIRYSHVMKENVAEIAEMDAYSKTIDLTRPELDSLYWNYEKVLYDLAVGQALLGDTVNKLREFSLLDWPKNFSPAFEREFGKPEKNEISQPTGDGSSTHVWYAYTGDPFIGLEPNFIRYANPIPINEFSMEKMEEQGHVNLFKPDPSMVYTSVDKQAEFPGGHNALFKYLGENYHVPEALIELGISLKLRMKFVVLEDGSLSNVTVYKGMGDCPECDREAIRVFKNMPKWKPAILKGKAVKSEYFLPINIHLN